MVLPAHYSISLGSRRQFQNAGKSVQPDFSREELSLPVKISHGQGHFQAGASGADEHPRLELSEAIQGLVDVQGLVDLIKAAQPGWIQWHQPREEVLAKLAESSRSTR